MSEGERKLATIVCTDIAGYRALTQRDEKLALSLLEEHRGLLRLFSVDVLAPPSQIGSTSHLSMHTLTKGLVAMAPRYESSP